MVLAPIFPTPATTEGPLAPREEEAPEGGGLGPYEGGYANGVYAFGFVV